MGDLRYPIGRFEFQGALSGQQRQAAVAAIASAPERLRAAVAGLLPAQLDTPYRPEGWTVRQVVHHVPDSHINAYTRFRLALTEQTPTIKPYEEGRWAELPDARTGPIEISLALMEALHRRWVLLLEQVRPDEWTRTLQHPEHGRKMSLDELLAMYAWHGTHHTAHITSLRLRMGWDERPVENLTRPPSVDADTDAS